MMIEVIHIIETSCNSGGKIDWQPVLCKHEIIKYIAKYTSKVKKFSETYQKLMMHFSKLEILDDLAVGVYRKLLIEIVIERDIGAQETCHMLLELPLVESSRKFVSLNVSHKFFKPLIINTNNNEEEHTKSFIQIYKI